MWLNDSGGTVLTKPILICLAVIGLAGCVAIGDSTVPIATQLLPAPRPAGERTLVIVLPGFGVDAREMNALGIGQAIQEAWPQTDVLLASATYAYYRDGKLIARLHDDVVAPVRAAYRRIWLAGASMGGMGALLYERDRPGMVTGVALFAPFLGSDAMLEEIRGAGGIGLWDPGPLPVEVNAVNYQRQVWKMVKGWSEKPQDARRIWLACGSDDRLLSGARLLATALPQAHFVEEPGGHTWATWARLSKSLFSKMPSQL